MDELWKKIQEQLNKDRYNELCGKVGELNEEQLANKAKDVELLALRLDIDQAHEIKRGMDLNVFKKSI